MTLLRPAPEGQPTSSIQRFLDHAKEDLKDWEGHVAYLKRQLATAERRVANDKSDVKLYEYQLLLRNQEGRFD